MKITKISQQVKRADRYSIFVDEKYSFSLSEAALITSGLHSGQELTQQELEQCKDSSKFDKLYNRTLMLIARRPRSRWELEDYLRRKDSPAPLTEQILNRLSKAGYVDDSKFAQLWVENRRLLRPTSKRKLIQELRQKRISQEVIDQTLREDEADEQSVLRELIIKKRRQTKYQDNLKLMQYLARQGFGYGDIKEVLNNEDAEYS